MTQQDSNPGLSGSRVPIGPAASLLLFSRVARVQRSSCSDFLSRDRNRLVQEGVRN